MIKSQVGEDNIDAIVDTPGLGIVWLAHPSSEQVETEILEKCLDRGTISNQFCVVGSRRGLRLDLEFGQRAGVKYANQDF